VNALTEPLFKPRTSDPESLGQRGELLILPSLKAGRGAEGGMVLTHKFISGLEEYRQHWPGRVTALVHQADGASVDMDPVLIDPRDPAHGVELRPESAQALAERIRNASVVLAFLAPYELGLARLCRRLRVPLVFVSEYSLRTEMQIVGAEVARPWPRIKSLAWLLGAEVRRLAALRLAVGLQCSGTPSYLSYRRFLGNTIIFHDNRVPSSEVISEEALEARLETLCADRPLRLVYGGRLAAMKGVRDLPRVALALKRRQVPFDLTIFGSGPLLPELEHDIARLGLKDQVRCAGSLDFLTGWLPTLRRAVDLFICCHPQGDPSSTYSEVMSCGIPVVSYRNEAARGLISAAGCGWAVPIGDADALAAQVALLHSDRQRIAAASRMARRFGATHHFEATFGARVGHLIRASRIAPVPAMHGAAQRIYDGA
jgi:colanic acid/amylovoran biosynthesis glycosyltransferase